MVQADAIAKLQEAGIPFVGSRFANDRFPDDKFPAEIGKAGNPRLVVLADFRKPNEFEISVKLMQTVRLTRDPSIEFEGLTWSAYGGGNTLEMPMIRRVIADLIDSFTRDYRSANPKQSASSGKGKSTDGKH